MTLGVREGPDFGLKKQLQDGIRHVRQPAIRFCRVNSDDFDPQCVAIGQKKSSVYITGNEGPENEPTSNTWHAHCFDPLVKHWNTL